jgi:hypothetical protein
MRSPTGSRLRYVRDCARRWRRLEIIQQNPLTVIDVGHTPDGIRQSLASLLAIHGADDWILVAGASRDKKADEIVGALAPSFDTIICTTAHHKGADAQGIRPPPARQSHGGCSCHSVDRGGGAALAGDGERTKPKSLCGGWTVPRDRICHHRERWPRRGFGIFLNVAHNPCS